MRKAAKWLITGVLTLGILGAGLWWTAHPTHYKYNDRFILGSTPQEIEERYGNFFRRSYGVNGQLGAGEYLIREDTPEWIMGKDNSLWFVIHFRNGVAVDTEVREGWPGG